MSSMNDATKPYIHPTAIVSGQAVIGAGTKVWHFARVREGAIIGADCIVGGNAYVDPEVRIGSRVKIENNASVFRGATIEDGVFIGPHAVITNDRYPRAVTPEGELKGIEDWTAERTLLREGCSIGASAVVVAGLTVGRYALVAAGAVLTSDAPDHGLMAGVPAKLKGTACCCGRTGPLPATGSTFVCASCGRTHEIGRSAR